MYKIMLADDEGIVRESLKFIVDKEFPGQFETFEAKTGRRVIELADEVRPDIAFMDIRMPGINGIGTDEEIIEKIMNHEKHPSETRGVGITNVMARLDLYYNNKEVFEMKSRKNEGTHVTIKIPLEDTNV